jgi:heat shock protein HslJ/predicted  nucleic acid-binding Zn-ribbon protein
MLTHSVTRLALAAALLATVSCTTSPAASEQPSGSVTIGALAGGPWEVTELRINDAMRALETGERVTLDVHGGNLVTGATACSAFAATYETEGQTIAFGDVTTAGVCSDPAVAATAAAFLVALRSARTVVPTEKGLSLRDASGEAMATLESRIDAASAGITAGITEMTSLMSETEAVLGETKSVLGATEETLADVDTTVAETNALLAGIEGAIASIGARIDQSEGRLASRLQDRFDKLASQVASARDALNARLQAMRQELAAVRDSLSTRLQDVAAKLEARISGLQDALETRVDAIDGKLDGLGSGLDERLTGVQDALDARLHAIEARLAAIEARLPDPVRPTQAP